MESWNAALGWLSRRPCMNSQHGTVGLTRDSSDPIPSPSVLFGSVPIRYSQDVVQCMETGVVWRHRFGTAKIILAILSITSDRARMGHHWKYGIHYRSLRRREASVHGSCCPSSLPLPEMLDRCCGINDDKHSIAKSHHVVTIYTWLSQRSKILKREGDVYMAKPEKHDIRSGGKRLSM